MTYETITIDIDARGVATLTLNRPDKHNAMNAAMIAELTDAVEKLGQAKDVRVVVLTGAGATFCAGGDLGWMKEQMAADRATRIAEARTLADMLFALNTMPKPLVGRVHGNAFGGGVGMAAVCDITLAKSGIRMGLTETRLGLIPATIGPYVLARMGEGRARRVFMNARLFGAEEAVDLGLIARVLDSDEDLDAAVDAEVHAYLACAPGAVAAAKAMARSLGPVIDSVVIDRSIEALADRWDGAEAAEGIGAFFEKRKADWTR